MIIRVLLTTTFAVTLMVNTVFAQVGPPGGGGNLVGQVDEIDGRLRTIEGQDLDSRVSTIEGQDLDSRVSTIEGQDLDNRVSTIEGQDLDSRVSTIEGQDLDNRLSDIEGGVNCNTGGPVAGLDFGDNVNVIVEASDVCDLRGARIDGNIIVRGHLLFGRISGGGAAGTLTGDLVIEPGGKLDFFGATVQGNITSEGAQFIRFFGGADNQIWGNVEIEGTNGVPLPGVSATTFHLSYGNSRQPHS